MVFPFDYVEKIDPKYIDSPNINFSLEYNEDDEELYKKQRIERGFDDTELWSLDYTISRFIIPRLKAYNKYNVNSVPSMVDSEELWHLYLNKMIKAFEICCDDDYMVGYDKELDKEKEEGLYLFSKYFQCLWD